MSAMLQVRGAFDPTGLCNPGKIIPAPRGCGEARAVATQTVTDPIATESGDASRSVFRNAELTKARTYPVVTAANSVTQTRAVKRHAQIAVKLNEDRIARELADIVGPQNVRRRSASNLMAASSGTARNIERAIEAAPSSEDEAAEIMKLAQREHLSVIPAGAGTWLDVGNSMRQADVILSTPRMSRIVQHEPADLVTTT